MFRDETIDFLTLYVIHQPCEENNMKHLDSTGPRLRIPSRISRDHVILSTSTSDFLAPWVQHSSSGLIFSLMHLPSLADMDTLLNADLDVYHAALTATNT